MFANVQFSCGLQGQDIMPANGEINSEFGVYRNVCCGLEVVLAAGAAFPDCPNHPRLPTAWKSISDDQPIRHVSHIPFIQKKRDPAA
ncbi:MAG TPA: hypothetical protein VGK48_25225 [Terriglobia bacterium]